ncbi:MAG: hypothetical protein IJT25_01355 [Clostridia bacterium]|nr:hypothetical protein [Clostridia bacterium]
MNNTSSTFDFWGEQTTQEAMENLDVVCPKCNQHLSDLEETYFVGCPYCYKVFAPYINKLVLKYHKKSEHIGKQCGCKNSKTEILKELSELSRAEKQAVVERDYLKAEEIKRKIQSLRGEINGSL